MTHSIRSLCKTWFCHSREGWSPVDSSIIWIPAFARMTSARGSLQKLVGILLCGLAVTTAAPSPAFPGLPTLKEFLPGYEVTTWYGMLVPHGTPAPVIARLYQETVKALKSPDILKRFEEFGAVSGGEAPQQFAALIKTETAKRAKVANDSGASID